MTQEFYRAIPGLEALHHFAKADVSPFDCEDGAFYGLNLQQVLRLAKEAAAEEVGDLIQGHLAEVFTLCEGAPHIDDVVSYTAFPDGTIARHIAQGDDPHGISHYTTRGVAFLPLDEVPAELERAAAACEGAAQSAAARAIAELAEKFPALVLEAAQRITLPKNSA